MKDPFGALLVLIRDAPAVVSIVTDGAAKVTNRAIAPPSVHLFDTVASRRPTGIGSGLLGLQYWQGIARCFGPDAVGGDVTARNLAGAVSDALHGRHAVPGTTFLLRVYAPEIDGVFRDPDTKWPYYDVRIEATAEA